MAAPMSRLLILLTVASFIFLTSAGKDKSSADEKWKKKDIRDYTEADLERLYEQWEENDDEELEEDEKPPWQREQPKIDLSNIDMSNPEAVLKASKKGKTVMMFVSLSGNPDQHDTEEISSLWHSSLINGNVDVKRYVTDPGRVLFVVDDGSNAWTVKDFLVQQDRCEDVTIDGKVYPGKAAKKDEL